MTIITNTTALPSPSNAMLAMNAGFLVLTAAVARRVGLL